jgi:muramoyltetrapeptide carboxypeptidase
MAPSTRTDRAALQDGIRVLYDLGYEVIIHDQSFLKHKSSAGTPDQKLAALYNLLSLPDIDAIIAAKGGNHALDLLDRMDYAFIRKHGKPIMGFSDTTAILNAIYARSRLVTTHGPTLGWLPRVKNPELIADLWAGKKVSFPLPRALSLRPGRTEGRLVGGNLSLLTSLIGTPYMPDCKGALLFLEDTGEEISRIDRMFIRLRLSGILNEVAGIVMGQFSDCTDTGRTPYGFRMSDIIERNFGALDIPVVFNTPFGHTTGLFPLPVGGIARLRVTSAKSSLALIEPAVSV